MLGTAETTEYPSEFEELLRRADSVVDVTERILKASEALLEPNPGKVNLVLVTLLKGLLSMLMMLCDASVKHFDSRASSTIWWSRRGVLIQMSSKTLQQRSEKQLMILETRVPLVCMITYSKCNLE